MNQSSKIGQGSVKAAFRKGFRELGAITQAFPNGIAVPDEPGQLWSTTQQAVSQQMGVSMPVHRSNALSQGTNPMNTIEPESQAEVATPEIEVTPSEGILDGLVENAQAMSQEREMTQEMEIEQ